MNVFEPFKIYLSPTLTAVESIPATSLPPKGSVTQRQPIISPSTLGTKYFCLISSLASLFK